MLRRLRASRCKPDAGFTMIELLVVMFAIVLVALSAMGMLQRVSDMYRKAETRSRLLEIKKGILAYYREQLELRRLRALPTDCSDFPLPWGEDWRANKVLRTLTPNYAYLTSYSPDYTMEKVKNWFSKIAKYLRGSGVNFFTDGWGRPWVVMVSLNDNGDSADFSSDYCTLSGDNYNAVYCPLTGGYGSIPKVLIMSLGRNGLLDTDLTNWHRNPNLQFGKDDIGMVVVVSEVDAEGVTYTETVLKRLADAASAYFSNCVVIAASNEGGVTASVVQTNWWTHPHPSSGQRLDDISKFRTVLGFTDEALRDFWGNMFSWNPSGSSMAPYVGLLQAHCGPSGAMTVTVVPSI